MRSFALALGLVALSLLPVRASADEPGAAPPPANAAQLKAETSAPASPEGQAADKQASKGDASPAAEAPVIAPDAGPPVRAVEVMPAPAVQVQPSSVPPATTAVVVTTEPAPAAGGLVASTEPPPPNKTLRKVGYAVLGAGVVAVVAGAILAGEANSAGNTVAQNNANGVYSQTAGASLERNEVAAAMVLGAGVMAAFAGTALILNN